MEISNQQELNSSSFRVWLQSEFSSRIRSQERYSLRAFARDLKMDASSLSQIMSGKRNISSKVIMHITSIIKVSDDMRLSFLRASLEERDSVKTEITKTTEYQLMAIDAFSYIADWYHIAILELINVDGFVVTDKSCADRLNISVIEARLALERLKRLDLIFEKEGKLTRTDKFLTNFSPGMTSKAHRSLQRQILQKAIEAIDACDPQEKDITAMTMAIDVKKIPEARQIIARFRRELCAYLEDGTQSQVYNLAIQLYPVSKSS